jgi:16S rRNA (cytidine1402-2'-O)-methyltransferase
MLYIVSSPIGNLKDITLRALETLKEADVILCEDTRVTAQLLRHYEIRNELISFNAQSETYKIQRVIDLLNSGKNVALISDAGTPTISDPGIRLVSEALKNDIQVIPIPGVSAPITALTIAGLPTDGFIFEGFIPQKKGRQKFLSSLLENDKTLVFFESSHRIEKLIGELAGIIPDRKMVICRELTKLHEEAWRGTAAELLEAVPNLTIKGEFVVLISPVWWK